jgi:hypothetical protein
MRALAETIAAVAEASQRLDEAEKELDARRKDLRDALTAAHEAGATYALLGRVIGTSRQYVQRVIAEGA